MAAARARMNRRGAAFNPFRVLEAPPGAKPPQIAQDEAVGETLAWAAQSLMVGAFREGVAFLGYPYLAELAQRPEFRRLSEVIARHMTRKWIKLRAKGDEDKSEKIARIEEAMKKLRVQAAFLKMAEQDGFFGCGHLFLDFGDIDGDELKKPIGNGWNAASKAKVKKGSLKKLKPVEAMWCYPLSYNSDDPLADDWYNPQSWWVMRREVHASRLLTFVSREVPDLLKPVYFFGGLPLSQMAKPYVENWLRIRQSVADIVQAFSVFVLKTKLVDQLNANNGEALFERADFFNAMRDNRGLLIVDKDNEDFANISASLASLDALQAQAQEHMAAVDGIPIVELLGIQPAGLNASSEGEIRTFYESIHAKQENLFRVPLHRILGFIQLSEFGEVDPDIDFDFEPLWSLDEKERAETQYVQAQTDAVLTEAGIVSTEEARTRLANDEQSPYPGLDLDAPPPEIGERKPEDPAASPPRPALDAEFVEAKHPRDEDGKFTEGAGHAASSGERETQRSSTGRGAGHLVAKVINGERRAPDGGPLPQHITALKLPPAWRDVTYSPDPDADLQATGRDQKGRLQAVYSTRFAEGQAAAKFARVKELDAKFTRIRAQNDEARQSDNPRTRDSADALKLIMETGIRPGSDSDTLADKKAYGATTLEGRHVVETPQGIRLQFTGKKGVDLDLPVNDPETAAMLLARARQSGPNGRLFASTNHAALLAHTHSLDGGSFKTKDFRTLLGTRTALEEIAKSATPKTRREYKRSVVAVAKKVSSVLGNTPTVALQSYINPAVFAQWRIDA